VPPFPQLAHPLTDGVVSLRPFAERDIPEILIAYQDDPKLHLRLGEERPPSGAALGRRAERADAERRAGVAIALVLTQAGDDTCRGEVVVPAVDWENQRAQLSAWVAAGARGRGYAARALGLASRWLLTNAGIERVEIFVDSANQPMIRAALGAGFTREGVLRGHQLAPRDGKRAARIDNVVLSMVQADLRP
jgi:ribosomal-protein-alanine N-acetyltransferase